MPENLAFILETCFEFSHSRADPLPPKALSHGARLKQWGIVYFVYLMAGYLRASCRRCLGVTDGGTLWVPSSPTYPVWAAPTLYCHFLGHRACHRSSEQPWGFGYITQGKALTPCTSVHQGCWKIGPLCQC